jgi:hypothetical protein
MKTYAEKKGEKPFDWNRFLAFLLEGIRQARRKSRSTKTNKNKSLKKQSR